MVLDEIKVLDFGKRIRFKKMNLFLTDVYLFFEDNYNYFVSYYSGDLKSLRDEDIEKFNSIKKRFIELDTKIQDAKNLNGLWDWQFVDFLDDLRESILKVPILWKYFKTERFGFRIRNGVQVQYVLPQGYTLERVSQDVIGSNDPQNEWVEISKGNFLKEKDYDHTGDVLLNLNIPNETGNVIINSIMDSAVGLKVLGKDIKRTIEFANDDLVVLDYIETFKQTCDILSSLKKNSIPEFPDLGLNNIVATNVANKGLAMNQMFKQINRVYASDDSIESINFKNVDFDNSSVFIDYEITAINSSGNTKKQTII
jgi:hypothetical protein